MLINDVERPAALAVAGAQVSGLFGTLATAAHVRVGFPVVAGPWSAGTTLIRTQAPKTRVQGTSVSAAQANVIDMDPVSGVRGRPPRGKPV